MPSLPGSKVDVLDLQGRRWRALAKGSSIEGIDLAQDDVEGPAVGGDVVDGEDQTVVLGVVGGLPRPGRVVASRPRVSTPPLSPVLCLPPICPLVLVV